ncbi:hypothetical protein BKN14_01450 [Candidatus Gracilibacteria bacterium HOT-871]|nr:hypothetical protein BKN14_01450 [Candidatus Gracilibacteria bacterium HOT-871]MBB1565224.1 DedA family protein [Candidatus Gracilibacteria bacterium]MBF0913846.1 DedA family protein [Candidatus Gracilibacteria bacterium]RKW23655.1 MAG: DedA family protein [Candidatus Gracilibacteria bacterium]
MLTDIINYVVEIAETLGYTGIFFMMVLESSFFPFPSEVAMIPAGYLASIGKMDFTIAFIVGTLGCIVGASINYVIGYFLGGKVIKKLIKKYGKYFFISVESYEKTDQYFKTHGSITTFVGRLIPVIRQLISIPAGIFKMNLLKFFFFTGVGAGIWNFVLMIIGFIAGKNQDLIDKYSQQALIGVILFVLFVVIFYYYLNKKRKGKSVN